MCVEHTVWDQLMAICIQDSLKVQYFIHKIRESRMYNDVTKHLHAHFLLQNRKKIIVTPCLIQWDHNKIVHNLHNNM